MSVTTSFYKVVVIKLFVKGWIMMMILNIG